MSPLGGTGWGGQLQTFPGDTSLWAMAAVPLLSTGVLGLVVGILVRLQPLVSATVESVAVRQPGTVSSRHQPEASHGRSAAVCCHTIPTVRVAVAASPAIGLRRLVSTKTVSLVTGVVMLR
jgi:hypothetical protein